MASANPLLALLVRMAPGLLLLQAASAQSFGPQQVLSSNGAFGAESAYATDLDGDGDADVLSTSLGDDRTSGSRIRGDPRREPGDHASAEDPKSVYATDLTGWTPTSFGFLQLRQDRLVREPRWRLLGLGQVITTSADGADSVYSIDLDGDGDADVLGVDDKIAWYENLGGGFSADPGHHDCRRQSHGYATDLDNDGDADVLSASANDNKIAWYEKPAVVLSTEP